MTRDVRIRSIEESDYDAIISVLDEWWVTSDGGHAAKTVLQYFNETSFLAEIGIKSCLLVDSFPQQAILRHTFILPEFIRIIANRASDALLYSDFRCMSEECQKHHSMRDSPVNKNSIAFHSSMKFKLEPSSEVSGNIPIHKNYDGPGEDRVLFLKRL